MTDELRFDLHIHSRYSPDSKLTVEAIAAAAAAGGLGGFALTDHNSVRGLGDLLEAQRQYRGYLFVPGVEVSTSQGHLLAYGLHEAPPVGRALEETIAWVEARSGVAVLAHPFRRTHGVGARATAEMAVPAIEVRNGHNTEIANARAELVTAQRRLGGTGGSDAHTIRDVGRAYTIVSDPVDTVEDLLEAIRRGHCRAEGRSLTGLESWRVGLRNVGLRLARGLRPV